MPTALFFVENYFLHLGSMHCKIFQKTSKEIFLLFYYSNFLKRICLILFMIPRKRKGRVEGGVCLWAREAQMELLHIM